MVSLNCAMWHDMKYQIVSITTLLLVHKLEMCVKLIDLEKIIASSFFELKVAVIFLAHLCISYKIAIDLKMFCKLIK